MGNRFIKFTNRFARPFITLVAFIVGLVCTAYVIGPEIHWSFAYLQYVPYYLFLLPALTAVLWSFLLPISNPACSTNPSYSSRRSNHLKWHLISVMALILVVMIIMGFSFGFGDAGSERIRVMTYNVKDYIAVNQINGIDAIVAEVARHDPDILVLQDANEINSLHEEDKDRQADWLKASIKSSLNPHITLPPRPLPKPLFAGKDVFGFGQYVVISRYPLKNCANGWISFREIPHTYVHCVVETGYTQINLVSAHLLTPRQGLNAVRHESRGAISTWQENIEDRMVQAKSLARDLQDSVRPIILAGDFNAPDQSLVMRTVAGTRLRDAFAAASFGFGYSYGHSLRPGISFLRIDHILVDQSIGVARAYVGGKEASPHRPVIADLLLNRQP